MFQLKFNSILLLTVLLCTLNNKNRPLKVVREDVQQIGPHPKNLKNNTKYEYLVLYLHLSLLLYFFFLDVDFFRSRIQKAATDVSKSLYNA